MFPVQCKMVEQQMYSLDGQLFLATVLCYREKGVYICGEQIEIMTTSSQDAGEQMICNGKDWRATDTQELDKWLYRGHTSTGPK